MAKNTSRENELMIQTLKNCEDCLTLFQEVFDELTNTECKIENHNRPVGRTFDGFILWIRRIFRIRQNAVFDLETQLEESEDEDHAVIEEQFNFVPKYRTALDTLQRIYENFKELSRHEIPMDSKAHELEKKLKRAVQSNQEAENKIQEAENKIRELSRKIERADPNFIDMKFTGNVQKRDKIENSVKTFFKYNYAQAMKKLNDSPNWNEEEVDDLLVGVSKFAYDSAKEVLLQGVCDELEDIFNHQASTLDDERELIRLRDLSQAFGLLLCHFKNHDLHSKTEEILQKKVKGDSHLSRLYEKVNDEGILKTFKEQFIENAVQMITMSPPMFMVMPEKFDNSINRIPNTTSDPPLHYRRLVIMKNYFGDVSMEGIAGNKESFLKIVRVSDQFYSEI